MAEQYFVTLPEMFVSLRQRVNSTEKNNRQRAVMCSKQILLDVQSRSSFSCSENLCHHQVGRVLKPKISTPLLPYLIAISFLLKATTKYTPPDAHLSLHNIMVHRTHIEHNEGRPEHDICHNKRQRRRRHQRSSGLAPEACCNQDPFMNSKS